MWKKIKVWVVKVDGQFKTQVDTKEKALKFAEKYKGKPIEIKQSEAEQFMGNINIW